MIGYEIPAVVSAAQQSASALPHQLHCEEQVAVAQDEMQTVEQHHSICYKTINQTIPDTPSVYIYHQASI
jgi:hypothetical protein